MLSTARILSAVCLLVLAAHFYRDGDIPLAVLSALPIGLLFIRRRWSLVALQTVLVLGAVEWLVTMIEFVRVRQQMGMPYARLEAILGSVALLCGLAAALLATPRVRNHHSPSAADPSPQ